jgi:anti-anti-sigma regulatory factor
MNIRIAEEQHRVPVTVMGLEGQLDASNYLEVIERVKALYDAGTRDLLLDLSDLSFMGSSGLVALHGIALILRGEMPADPEQGWGAFHALARDREGGVQAHCKLLNPQPPVARVLQITGFGTFLEVFTDRDVALAAF